MKRGLLVTVLLLGVGAWAQADLPDAGLPDAAVGQEGAERASEEEDQSFQTPCLSSRDCDRGLACVAGTCKWQRYRDATYEGCGVGSGLFVLGAGLLLTRRSRHFLSNFTK